MKINVGSSAAMSFFFLRGMEIWNKEWAFRKKDVIMIDPIDANELMGVSVS